MRRGRRKGGADGWTLFPERGPEVIQICLAPTPSRERVGIARAMGNEPEMRSQAPMIRRPLRRTMVLLHGRYLIAKDSGSREICLSVMGWGGRWDRKYRARKTEAITVDP
jgi:hypothetical protein